MSRLQTIFCGALVGLLITTAAFGADFTAGLKPGKADIKFAGALMKSITDVVYKKDGHDYVLGGALELKTIALS